MEAVSATEKPLSPGAKVALMFGAGIVVLFYYLTVPLMMALLAALLVGELALLILVIQFGLGVHMLVLMHQHRSLFMIFLRSLWLEKGVDFRLALEEEDAPGLFAMLRELGAKLKIEPPQTVNLEMSLGAWVMLKGYRRGHGQTTLGVGFDLLAGLSKAEMEGVMAHEMTHAKMIQRGIKGWLVAGFSRLVNLTTRLSMEEDAYKNAEQKNELAGLLHKGCDWLARLAMRQISAYSRQDEFEADRGAAELCGSAKIRSSLQRLTSLEEITAKLPWKERVARLQLEGGYSGWLRQELAKADTLPQKPQVELFSKYSTHPLVRDRLAALPEDHSSMPATPEPAIELLSNPDAVADKLVQAIQKKQVEAEELDSKELKKWTRKVRGRIHLRPLQSFAFVLFLVGFIYLISVLVDRDSKPSQFTIAFALLAGSVAAYQFGKYKDKTQLPLPEYTSLIRSWRELSELKDIENKAKKHEEECESLGNKEPRTLFRAKVLAAESYAALERGDYLRAHVAAQLSLKWNAELVEGIMGYFIASAALNMQEQAAWALARLRELTGLASSETTWGTAWALMLIGDWGHAEAFLEEVRARRAEEPSILLLLALTQTRRGKFQSAIKNAREAITLNPQEDEGAKLFINLLLEGGHLREAQEQLTLRGDKLKQDPELLLALVRALLIKQEIEPAIEWAEQLKEKVTQPHQIMRLGEAFEEARQHRYAAGCYQRVLSQGYYPEAYVGLGRTEADRQNNLVAESYFLSALELKRTLGEKAAGPQAVFQEAVGRLLLLKDPVLNCRAWVATLTGSATPDELKHKSFLVYAPELRAAEDYFKVVLQALRKDMPPLLPASLVWKEASGPQKPDGPVRPGVQGLIS